MTKKLEFNETYTLEFLLDTFGAKKVNNMILTGDIFKTGTGVYQKC